MCFYKALIKVKSWLVRKKSEKEIITSLRRRRRRIRPIKETANIIKLAC